VTVFKLFCFLFVLHPSKDQGSISKYHYCYRHQLHHLITFFVLEVICASIRNIIYVLCIVIYNVILYRQRHVVVAVLKSVMTSQYQVYRGVRWGWECLPKFSRDRCMNVFFIFMYAIYHNCICTCTLNNMLSGYGNIMYLFPVSFENH
jgi:hypothetical protein